MHWILQTNVFNEWGMKHLVEVLLQNRITFSVHKVVPFVGTLEPNIHPEGNVMIMGSHSLRYISKERNWFPGVFDLSHVTYQDMISKWETSMLNHDAKLFRFDSVEFPEETFFVKPDTDLKLFAGYVTTKEEFQKWQCSILGTDLSGGAEPMEIKPHTNVVVCPVKDILEEARFWIVDGEIITWSRYKIGNKVKYCEEVEYHYFEFVERMIKVWQPSRAFVIDIAKVAEETFKVIEINTLNCSGLYHCVPENLVHAIENMKC